jgi:hypothetical protein
MVLRTGIAWFVTENLLLTPLARTLSFFPHFVSAWGKLEPVF